MIPLLASAFLHLAQPAEVPVAQPAPIETQLPVRTRTRTAEKTASPRTPFDEPVRVTSSRNGNGRFSGVPRVQRAAQARRNKLRSKGRRA